MNRKIALLLTACLPMMMQAEVADNEVVEAEQPTENIEQTAESVELKTDMSVCSDEAYVNNNYLTLSSIYAPVAEKWKRDDVATVPKFGGYIIGSYKYDEGSTANNGDGFGLRLVRLYVDGTVLKDFKYRLQMEVNGTPHIKDATLEWVKWKFLQMKVGQFKRAFTFENPYNPWDVGVGDYSQLTKKLAGMGDRCGETSMGGRDLGFQLQGDLLKSKRDGHYLLHYQAAVYNGQGINRKDQNKDKDFIGTVQVSPIKYLTLGAFGWLGNWYSEDKKITLNRNRYAFGIKYENPENGWSARAEYAHSQGRKASDWVQVSQNADGTPIYGWSEKSLAQNGGDKSDAWYVTVGVPVWRWIKVYGKYDAYRDYATNSSMKSIYSLSCNMQPHKNLMLQLQYNYNDDKTSAAPMRHYSQLWLETYVRF